MSAAWSQHPSLPAHACIPERAGCARQDALVTRACGLAAECQCWHLEAPGVKVGLDVGGLMSSVALGMKGWTQQWDVHGIFLHATHSTLNRVSSNN